MNPRLQLSTTLQHRKIEFASMFPPAVSGLENPHTFVAADCGVFKMLCLNVASTDYKCQWFFKKTRFSHLRSFLPLTMPQTVQRHWPAPRGSMHWDETSFSMSSPPKLGTKTQMRLRLWKIIDNFILFQISVEQFYKCHELFYNGHPTPGCSCSLCDKDHTSTGNLLPAYA